MAPVELETLGQEETDTCEHGRREVKQKWTSTFGSTFKYLIMTPKNINIHCNWGFLTSQISHLSKKCEIKCPAQKLTTQYKFCLMDADTKRTGGDGRLNADNCGQWREGCQKLAKSCGCLLWMAPYQFLPFYKTSNFFYNLYVLTVQGHVFKLPISSFYIF